MNSETISAIFGLFVAIATIAATLLIAGGFAYAVTRVFTDHYPR